MQPDTSNQGKLYATALLQMGKDASPADRVPDDVACAESVTTILRSLWSQIPIITGTYTLWEYLKRSPLFRKTDNPESGCIIISPTGTGNGKLRNGHVGIVGESIIGGSKVVMSNDSASGLFMEFYTIDSWKRKFGDFGGFPVEFYRPI